MAYQFSGKYSHNLDSKGRIIIPAKFKKNIGENPFLSLGIDGCLTLYPAERWFAFLESLNELPGNLEKVRTMKRILMANSVECEIDSQGRILITQELREKAGLVKNVVFVGVGNKIELWDKEKFDEIDSVDNLMSIAESLGEFNIDF